MVYKKTFTRWKLYFLYEVNKAEYYVDNKIGMLAIIIMSYTINISSTYLDWETTNNRESKYSASRGT